MFDFEFKFQFLYSFKVIFKSASVFSDFNFVSIAFPFSYYFLRFICSFNQSGDHPFHSTANLHLPPVKGTCFFPLPILLVINVIIIIINHFSSANSLELSKSALL